MSSVTFAPRLSMTTSELLYEDTGAPVLAEGSVVSTVAVDGRLRLKVPDDDGTACSDSVWICTGERPEVPLDGMVGVAFWLVQGTPKR